MFRVFIIVSLLCCANNANAKYLVTISEQVVEETEERKARATAIDQATDEVTLEMVKKEIGEQRYKENLTRVESEIKQLKNRFIPFFKILSSQKEGESYRFQIEVKVSRSDLRHVLQQKGLFASDSKTGITLPFVEFNNQINGESYRWWSQAFGVSKDLESLALLFENEMFDGFLKKGLFLLRPQAFSMIHMVPDFMRRTYITQTEMVQLTGYKQGQLYLDGRVDVITSPLRENAYRLRVQISCKQSSNGKSVAEVVKTLDAPSGKQLSQIYTEVRQVANETGKDLSAQVYDLWQRGALEAQVLKLAVTGDLNHQQLLEFKKVLSDTVGASEGLKERLFEPGRVTYEMDYTGGVDALVRKLKSSKFEGFYSQVVSSQADEIILDVKVAQQTM